MPCWKRLQLKAYFCWIDQGITLGELLRIYRKIHACWPEAKPVTPGKKEYKK